MIDPMQQNMIDHLRKKSQGVQDIGNPAPVAVAPNPLMHNPSQQPFQDRRYHELKPAEQEQRRQWMLDEASRLIASRQQGQAPYKPFTPQYPTPQPFDAGAADRDRITDIARQLAGRLAERDPT